MKNRNYSCTRSRLAACMFALMACFQFIYADLPFRNHRYDGFKGLSVSSDNIVFIGNSITNMFEWWEAFNNPKILNRGVSGGYTHEVLANLESMIAGKPEKVFLMIGTNDLGTSGYNSVEYVSTNIEKIIERITKESPNTKLYVQSILPSAKRDLKLQEATNKKIKEICTGKANVEYIDLWNALLEVSNTSKNELTYDHLHLTAKGYKIWLDAIADKVGSTVVLKDVANDDAGLGTNNSNGMRATYFNALPLEASDVVIMGDEMIHGGEWHELLGGIKVKSRSTGWGYPGADMAGIQKLVKVSLTNHNADPKKLFLYAGASEANGTMSLDEMVTKYNALVDAIQAAAPATKLFLMSLLPTDDANKNTTRVQEFNKRLQTIATQQNATYIDIYTALEDTNTHKGKAEYFNGKYIYGKGYAKVSELLATHLTEENAQAVTEALANKRFAQFNARAELGNTISACSMMQGGTAIGQYNAQQVADIKAKCDAAYALLAKGGEINEITAKSTELETAKSAALSSIAMPSTDVNTWYQLVTSLRDKRYLTNNGVGQAASGDEASSYAKAMWRFEQRADKKTYNLVNRKDNSYLVPNKTNNGAMTTATEAPADGWTLSYSNTTGMYILSCGTAQLHQLTSDRAYGIINWSNGFTGTDRDDAGCQFTIQAAGEVEEEPTLPKPILNIEHITLNGKAPYRVSDEKAKPVLKLDGDMTLVIDFTSAAESNNTQALIAAADTTVANRFFTGSVWANHYGVVYRTAEADGNDQKFTKDLQGTTAQHKIFYVLDKTNKLLKYYLDGKLISTFDFKTQSAWRWGSLSSVDIPGANAIFLGGFVSNTTDKNKWPFKGKIHSARVFDQALVDAQLKLLTYVEPAPDVDPTPENPFEVTTITDGKFASNTKWYTMQIGSNGFYISDNGSADHIALSKVTTEYADEDLWCFTGDNTAGYSIYNKKATAAKVLASPKTMTGTTGATSYVVLKDKEPSAAEYSYEWTLQPSADLADRTAWYMGQKGSSSNFVNNRDGKLAFWTTGKDHGSSMVFTFVKETRSINTETGSLAGTGGFSNTWESKDKNPVLRFISNANNIGRATSDATKLDIRSGSNNNATYSFSVPVGFRVSAYSFTATSKTDGNTIIINNKEHKIATTESNITITVGEDQEPTFTLRGDNKEVFLSNFTAEIVRTQEKPEPSVEIFKYTRQSPYQVVYRIPAITTTQQGTVIAVADYRHSGNDIGMSGRNGKIDLHVKTSADNGANWGEKIVAVAGMGNAAPTDMWVGFGDPAIVADRTSNNIFMLSCAGAVSFPGGTRNNHQFISTFRSTDEGKTWSKPVDIAEHIYKQFDGWSRGPASSMFVGSGKIHQSRYIKVGEFYRLYCAVLMRDKDGRSGNNYVLYSDDFGHNWKVLGDVEDTPITTGDEPKVEELPDGSILLSSRAQGRLFNIFSFTDAVKGEGKWGTACQSLASNNGGICAQGGNPTNGEILIVPAIRKADNKKLFVALQSVPFGPNRSNVGIYYKELESKKEDYATPEVFASNWDGRHQSTRMNSAYSTMTLQKDNNIGFLYEESTYGCDYTIIYKNYSLEYITDSLYVINPNFTEEEITAYNKEAIGSYYQDLASNMETSYVGQPKEESKAELASAANAYVAEPSQANYEAFYTAYFNLPVNELQHGKVYTAENVLYPGVFLSTTTAKENLVGTEIETPGDEQKFAFLKEGDYWAIKKEGEDKWMPATGAVYSMTTLTDKNSKALYNVVSNIDGNTYFQCTTPAHETYTALHCDGQKNIVPWTTGATGSLWKLKEVGTATAIETVKSENETNEVKFFDITGRPATKLQRGFYIGSNGKKYIRR